MRQPKTIEVYEETIQSIDHAAERAMHTSGRALMDPQVPPMVWSALNAIRDDLQTIRAFAMQGLATRRPALRRNPRGYRTQDYGMLPERKVRKVMGEAMMSGDPPENMTELAEIAAWELEHDEWLDDPTHPVWDWALETWDQYA